MMEVLPLKNLLGMSDNDYGIIKKRWEETVSDHE